MRKAPPAPPGALAVAFCHPIPSGGDGGKVAGGGHRPRRHGGPGRRLRPEHGQGGLSARPGRVHKRAKNTDAVFHPVTGRLWYNEQPHGFRSSDPVVSRDTKAGATSEQRVPYAKIPSLLRQDGPTAATVLATSGVHGRAVPSGGVVATGAQTGGIRLTRVADKGWSGADACLTDLDTKGLGEDGPDCAPSFWRDATTLVCEFEQITVTADHKKVVKTEDLAPKNDRVGLPPVPSPDGKSFAFLPKGEGGQWALFRGDFTGGAQPVKVANVDQPLDGADKHRTSLIRWN
ncbi:hypothetical protein AABB02_01945 [Streptomyces rimosus]|uniref:hypothetical protein n=1 Tax=Streptomyces rimosus TaxID=1927 RepID=UPI0031DD1259